LKRDIVRFYQELDASHQREAAARLEEARRAMRLEEGLFLFVVGLPCAMWLCSTHPILGAVLFFSVLLGTLYLGCGGGK